MTRLWAEAEPINVECNAPETPRAFVWRGKTHAVEGIAQRWRVDVDWWRRRVWREYFKLFTKSGLLVELYCDLLTGEWYLQRLYD